MDPRQTLTDILVAIAEGDTDQAVESLRALATWIEGGGFAPKPHAQDYLNAYANEKEGR